jgi:hypothetical protein
VTLESLGRQNVLQFKILYKITATAKEKPMHHEFRQLYQPRFQRRSEWLRRVWRWF